MIRVLTVLIAAVIAVGVSLPGRVDRAVKRATVAAEGDAANEDRRYVDMGVTMHVVRKDPQGRELIKGMPLSVRVAEPIRLGGMVDTWGDRPTICGPSRNPTIWTCSDAMAPLVLHGDSLPVWVLCTGGMGAGKTTALAQWVYCRMLEHLGHADRQIGVFAPTAARMTVVVEAIGKLWRPEWMVGRRLVPTDRDGILKFRAGPSVRFVSAHQQSAAEGTRIAGFNLVAGAADEMQDFFAEWPNILARLRSDPNGRNKLFASCTAKDNTPWRNFKEQCASVADWHIVRIPGIDSPFITDSHWRKMKDGGVSLRQWQQIALAIDVGPEGAVYHCFARKLDDGTPGNLRPIPPQPWATDITAEVLAAYQPVGGNRIGLLIGHDPGKRQHVSVFLKAYRFASDEKRGDLRPRWFVVDEITSPDCTVHSHAQQVLGRAREKWHCNTLDRTGKPSPYSDHVLVRIDPHSRAEKSAHPGPDVYATWRSLGMLAKAAAYKPNSREPSVIPKDSRINMVNTLLCAVSADEHQIRRLYIACDDKGKEAAPKTLAALESMERDAAGEAETERKNEYDLSHWPAAIGYALWQVEHQRAGRVAA